MKKFIAAAVLCSGAFSASAQSATPIPTLEPAGWRGLMGLEVTGGGDPLVSLRYTDGTSSTIRAGEGLVVRGGAEYRVNSQIRLTGTLGYHVKRTPEADVELHFSRFPLELISSFAVQPNFEIGIGLRKALRAGVRSSGRLGAHTTNAQSSLGAIVQAEWLLNPKMGLTLRYVRENYEFFDGKSSGDHIGLGFNAYF